MRAFITGGTGLVGRRLVLDRLYRGDQVVVLSRTAGRASRLFAAKANPQIEIVEGDPAEPGPWMDAIDGCDAVVHLAGASVADRRWNRRYKQELIDSRVSSTLQVVRAVEAAAHPPTVLVNASAIGWYGDTKGRETSEDHPTPGSDFLAQLCVEWEKQARYAEHLGTRVVLLRIGLVLDERGGSVHKMVMPFKWFVGGPIGRGRKYMSWIHWRDLIGLIDLALASDSLAGPVNAVAPAPIQGREFSAALGAAVGRPSWLPVPPLALRVFMGEFGKFVTMDQRIVPRRAIDAGYHYLFRDADDAIEALFRREEVPTTTESPPVVAAAVPAREKTAGPSAQPRLIAIDVDGTLLRRDGHVDQGVVDACRAAERAGAAVVLATARTPRAMAKVTQTLNLSAPTINFNGAVIWNPKEGRALYHEAMDAKLAREVVRIVREVNREAIVSVDILDRWYTDCDDVELHWPASNVTPEQVENIDQLLREPVTRLTFFGDVDVLDRQAAAIRGAFGEGRPVALYRSHHNLLQVVHPLADKGICLQRMAAKLGLEASQVMAIGDGDNDLGMLEWAGFGVAMANGCEAARTLADAVVPSNEQLGVARALHRFALSPQAAQ